MNPTPRPLLHAGLMYGVVCVHGTSLRGLCAAGAPLLPLYLKNSCNRGTTTHTYIAMRNMTIKVMATAGCMGGRKGGREGMCLCVCVCGVA